ncbi:hypothetical protein CS063_00855 [Sporanaerobium hydrogeniformans]|uniref:Uncharacterized protein n=1 Tax=Sporanaerobium hydrogeniformans TaxID=3072179 RepID=A0AC61DFK8_9FIRM|nr:YaiI/YqxD family protein [Sporanaerobium hydrogeniformans]PHV72060.1 hypothetical protein CS063_00855 [Sporanaerobium hydrogeniformans]
MKILIDADGCPVVELTLQMARQFNIEVCILCDTSHRIERQGVETIVVSKGADAVDFVLINKVQAGDIVVTQDYGLAAMVLSKKGHPIHQNGMLYTEDNIDQLLWTRHLAKEARRQGGHLKGPKKRQHENNEAFKQNLYQLIEELLETNAL